jgi:hypothetical protein
VGAKIFDSLKLKIGLADFCQNTELNKFDAINVRREMKKINIANFEKNAWGKSGETPQFSGYHRYSGQTR